MEIYFNIKFEFDKEQVHKKIEDQLSKPKSDFICVVDGNILARVHKYLDYREIINDSLFSISDSGYVPIYLKSIYGVKYDQYRGADIFKDIVSSAKFRMAFVGTDRQTLYGLKNQIISWNPQVKDMMFMELPYMKVEDFDYEGIAKKIDIDGAEIIWVALGAPKQEIFMYNLKRRLQKSHVMIGVGAVFNFFGNNGLKEAPAWMIKYKLEFIYRILHEPKKQLKKFIESAPYFPIIYWKERKKSNQVDNI